jgi:hypothetical protein
MPPPQRNRGAAFLFSTEMSFVVIFNPITSNNNLKYRPYAIDSLLK